MRRLGRERASQGRLQHTAVTSCLCACWWRNKSVSGSSESWEGAAGTVLWHWHMPAVFESLLFRCHLPSLVSVPQCAEVVCLLLSLCPSCFLVYSFLNVLCPWKLMGSIAGFISYHMVRAQHSIWYLSTCWLTCIYSKARGCWRVGSVVKGTCCSCWGYRYDS